MDKRQVFVTDDMQPDQSFFDDDKRTTWLTDGTEVPLKRALKVTETLAAWAGFDVPAELFGEEVLLGQDMGQNRLRALLLYCEGRSAETSWTASRIGKSWSLESDLDRQGWLLPNGDIDAKVKAVIQVALRDTGGHVEIISPFAEERVATEDERRRREWDEQHRLEREEAQRREQQGSIETRLTSGKKENLADAMDVVQEIFHMIFGQPDAVRQQRLHAVLTLCERREGEITPEACQQTDMLLDAAGDILPNVLNVVPCLLRREGDRVEIQDPFDEPDGHRAFDREWNEELREERELAEERSKSQNKQEKGKGKSR